MRIQIQTSVGTTVDELVYNKAIILNDDDIDRLFGWEIFKVTKKYTRLYMDGNVNKLQEDKVIELQDLRDHAEDITQNNCCIRLYYLFDDKLQKYERLTLVDPDYCSIFLQYYVTLLSKWTII